MRKTLLLFISLLSVLQLMAQDKPIWVLRSPSKAGYYTGIVMTPKSEENYAETARLRAITTILEQIHVEVSSASLLHNVLNKTEDYQSFEKAVQVKTRDELTNVKFVTSWQNDEEYWVYYELSEADYEAFQKARRDRLVKAAFDFFIKGRQATEQGELVKAADLYTQGLAVVEPILHQSLACKYGDQTIDVGRELYNALLNVFSGLAITTNVQSVAARTFQPVPEPIYACVSRGGVALQGIPVHAEFVKGEGELTTPDVTDYTGTTHFSVTTITSKLPLQQVRITIASDALKTLVPVLRDKIAASLPSASVTLNLSGGRMKAWMDVRNEEFPTLTAPIRNILTQKYFDIVEDRCQADAVVRIDTQFQQAGTVDGGLYPLRETYGTLSLVVLNNYTAAEVLRYSVDQVKTLVEDSKNAEQKRSAAAREMSKRVNRELPARLNKIHLEIPAGAQPICADVQPAVPEPEVQPAPPVEVTPPVAPLMPTVPERPAEPAKPAVPEPQPAAEPAAIEGEIAPGIFVVFESLRHVNEQTLVNLRVENRTNKDFKLHLYYYNLSLVNQDGEGQKVLKMKLGSSENSYDVDATVVPEVPTKFVLSYDRLENVPMLSLEYNKNTLKLRNLK
ncbi:MAG: LPP20 family lipoprotein [Alloprevotella sp.]